MPWPLSIPSLSLSGRLAVCSTPLLQDYLMQLPGRLERLAERAASRKRKSSSDKQAALARFSWVFNQEVAL